MMAQRVTERVIFAVDTKVAAMPIRDSGRVLSESTLLVYNLPVRRA